jgi:hypothetical protein
MWYLLLFIYDVNNRRLQGFAAILQQQLGGE